MQAPPQPPRNPLVPATHTQLNTKSSIEPETRKRKRSDSESRLCQDLTFDLIAVDPTPERQRTTFTAVTSLSRADLPLAWIDQTSLNDTLPGGHRLADARVTLRNIQHGVIMVARLLSNGRLYVLERLKQDVFTAVLLQNRVFEELCCTSAQGPSTFEDLQAVPESLTAIRRHSQANSCASSVSQRPPTPSSPKRPQNRKGAFARKSILMPKEPTYLQLPTDTDTLGTASVGPQGTTLNTIDLPSPELASPAVLPMLPSDQALPAPSHPGPNIEAANQQAGVPGQEPPAPKVPIIVDTDYLRTRYLETLYLSKTSLAFYAKGPLSRARALTKDTSSKITLNDLKELYSSSLLPLRKFDKKYKESISHVLKDLANPQSDAKKRRKRSSTVKLGKNCLYTGEDELIKQWWDGRPTTSNATTHDAELRRCTTDLRNREAEMQLLLLLELLILELAETTNAPGFVPEDKISIKQEPDQDELPVASHTPSRKSKTRDYHAELDALLDRLCIWHTVTLEELVDTSKDAAEDSSTTQQTKDRLKDLCTDIIVPFYAAKLHDEVKIICKKLGGPNISPQRPRPQRTSSDVKSDARPTSSLSKAKGHASSKTSLQRVLSQDHDLRRASPPILSRSSTDRRKSSLKRESSESSSRPSSRAGLQKSVSFSHREIDLDADARTQDVKKRKLDKLAGQKQELRAAIEALKKPNRTTVAREIMDEVEKRGAVQITATPRKGKSRMIGASTSQGDECDSIALEPPFDPVIPSSTLKTTLATAIPRSSKKKRAVLSAIHDTPSRGDAGRTRNALAHGPLLPNGHGSIVSATPSTSRVGSDSVFDTPLRSMSTKSKPVLFTPLKRGEVTVENSFKDAPEIPEQAGKAMDRVMGGKGVGLFAATRSQDISSAVRGSDGNVSEAAKEVSLYEQLGWDDEFADL
jgi:DNA replication regulator SLD3